MSTPSFRPYPTYAELTRRLESLATEFPTLCSLEAIGTSPQGRSIWLMTVTDLDQGKPSEKPGIWLDGNTHAAELASSSMCLYTVERLCREWSKDSSIQALLRDKAFYVVPRISPDGAEFVLQEGKSLRSSPRTWPDNRPPGFDYQDMNGDGQIRQMRVESKGGAWKSSALDSRLLVRREPGDVEGPFYDLYPEGMFEEGVDPDLLPLSGSKRTFDFNRNYPFRWRGEHEQVGAGSYPLMHPETRAVVDAFLARKSVSVAVTYHTYCGAILRPFAYQVDQQMNPHDLYVYKALAEKGSQETGYPAMSVYHGFLYRFDQTVSGGFDDWAYDQRGTFAFTVELWSLGTEAGISVDNPANFYFLGERTEEQTHQILQWCDAHLGEEAFANWEWMEHPQLGRLEVGGWNRIGVWQNPPAAYLDPECAKNFEFVRHLANSTPQLSEVTLRKTRVGETGMRIEALVSNTGYLPTQGSERALKHSLTPPFSFTIELSEGARLADGKARVEIEPLTGVTSVHAGMFPDAVYFSGSSRSNVGKASWVIEGTGSATVHVDGGRAGCRSARISLDA